jgi:hypothetical protein
MEEPVGENEMRKKVRCIIWEKNVKEKVKHTFVDGLPVSTQLCKTKK